MSPSPSRSRCLGPSPGRPTSVSLLHAVNTGVIKSKRSAISEVDSGNAERPVSSAGSVPADPIEQEFPC